MSTRTREAESIAADKYFQHGDGKHRLGVMYRSTCAYGIDKQAYAIFRAGYYAAVDAMTRATSEQEVPNEQA